jgi:ribosomal protein S18 acetylase RimI-like enzyme
MTEITYTTDIRTVDWDQMKSTLANDEFDNGRSAEQLRRSFENSQRCCIALAEGRIIGTVRALSDGVCNAYVVDVWTHSFFRRRGIGSRMVEILVDSFPGQHVHLFSDVPEFYESMGFERHDVSLSKTSGTWLQNDTLAL